MPLWFSALKVLLRGADLYLEVLSHLQENLLGRLVSFLVCDSVLQSTRDGRTHRRGDTNPLNYRELDFIFKKHHTLTTKMSARRRLSLVLSLLLIIHYYIKTSKYEGHTAPSFLKAILIYSEMPLYSALNLTVCSSCVQSALYSVCKTEDPLYCVVTMSWNISPCTWPVLPEGRTSRKQSCTLQSLDT